MSPRSEELLTGARDRLGAARVAFDAGFFSNAASASYYAMLYAARAALSECDLNARTHSGTWALFRETFVEPGDIGERLFADAHALQQLREATDYDAVLVDRARAHSAPAVADRFVAAVSDRLGA